MKLIHENIRQQILGYNHRVKFFASIINISNINNTMSNEQWICFRCCFQNLNTSIDSISAIACCYSPVPPSSTFSSSALVRFNTSRNNTNTWGYCLKTHFKPQFPCFHCLAFKFLSFYLFLLVFFCFLALLYQFRALVASVANRRKWSWFRRAGCKKIFEEIFLKFSFIEQILYVGRNSNRNKTSNKINHFDEPERCPS